MPEYEIAVDQPNRPDGDPIEIPSVGVVPNGKSVTVELTAEEAEALTTAYGVEVKTSGGTRVKAKVRKGGESE